MVEPCNCLGDYQYVHVDCWDKWLREDFDERDMGCQRCESNWKIDSTEGRIGSLWVFCEHVPAERDGGVGGVGQHGLEEPQGA